MQKYAGALIDKSGAPMSGVTVSVFRAGTVTLVPLFGDNIGTVKANPFTNDANGSIEFYAANGRVDIVFSKTGVTFDNNDTKDILLYDPSDAVGGTIFGQNVYCRTHPDADKAAAQAMLVKADRLILESTVDGSLVNTTGWDRLTASLALAGAGGLDTGSEQASTWYELWAIRKSSDGTKALIWHRAKDWFSDSGQQFTTTDNAGRALRLSTGTATDLLAQGFKTATAGAPGAVVMVDVKIVKNGTPTGNFWFDVRPDAAGNPSGSISATSDKLDVSKVPTTGMYIRLIFRLPTSTADTTTQYHLVMNGDYTRSDTNNISWRGVAAGGYANGSAKENNGSTWTAASGVGDFNFKVYTERNSAAVTMPSGYDQKALLQYFYNDGSSNLRGQISHDRKARVLAAALADTDLGDFGNGVTLIDLATFVPPVPVRLECHANQNTGVTRIGYGPVPDGYSLDFAGTVPGKGGGAVVVAEVVGADARLVLPFVHTEYQAMYGGNGASGGEISEFYLTAWEW